MYTSCLFLLIMEIFYYLNFVLGLINREVKSMSYAVEVANLVKYFGKFQALKGISFNVDEGEIYGLIGPNGAGKTTTFRIIVGLIAPTSGLVKVLGRDVETVDIDLRKKIAYLPEDAGTYRNITGYEFLKMVAEIYFPNDKSRFEEALELGIKLADLGDKIHDKMKTYSKGMKRRVQVARALMIKPKLAVLDEPTVGLDVIFAREVRETIKNFSREYGTTILMSSHNMLEVEGVCDRVALIDKGRIIAEGYVSDLLQEHGAKNLEELFVMLVRGEEE